MHEITKKSRLTYIDWAKTISIALIIIGHFFADDSPVRIMLYSFHVPIFFFIAGILFKPNQNKSFQRIIFPYIFYFLVSALIAIVIAGQSPKVLIDITYYNGRIGLWNSVLWFFPCYFIVIKSFEFLLKKFKNKIWITLLISILLSIFCFYNKNLSYFGINKCILLYCYVCIGYLQKDYFKLKQNESMKNIQIICYAAIFILSLLVYWSLNKNNPISINRDDINNVVIYLIFSVTECFLLLILCKNFKTNKKVITISNNTIFIMCTHLFFRIFIQKFFELPTQVYQFLGIMVFIIEVLIIIILSKFPFLKEKKIDFLGLNFK